MRLINRRLLVGAGGGGDPPDTANLVGWWKADAGVFSDAGTTAAVNNDPVQQWNDQSGNGNHVTQSTLGNRPIFKTNVQNSLPGLDFVSSDLLTLGSALVADRPVSVYAVVSHGSLTASAIPVWLGTNTSDTGDEMWLGLLGNVVDDPVRWQVRSGAATRSASTTTAYTSAQIHLLTGIEASGTSRLVRRDGANEVTNSDSSTSLSGLNDFAIGMTNRATPSAPVIGNVLEVLVYSVGHDATTMGEAESYLTTKWGL